MFRCCLCHLQCVYCGQGFMPICGEFSCKLQLTCSKFEGVFFTASAKKCFSPVDSSEFWKADWPKEQLADPDLSRVIFLFKCGPVVLKILKEWKKLEWLFALCHIDREWIEIT